MEGFDFWRSNCSTAATKDTDMFTTSLVKKLANVGEIFYVTTLVRCKCNTVGIFLNGTINHCFSRLVVTQVNYLSTG